MRVLFTSTFGHGHVFPMVPLARAFMDAGHDVLWATHGDAVLLVEAAGITVAQAGLSGQPLADLLTRLHREAERLPGPDRAAFMFPTLFAESLAPPMASDLLPLARDWQPDLLIHEHGELASPLVGAVLGVPSLTHSFGGGIPRKIVAAAADRLARLWKAHGKRPEPLAGCFTAPYLDICPPRVQTVSLEHVPTRQPLRPVPYGGEPPTVLPDCLQDDPRPLVYITLGTVTNHAAELAAAVSGISRLHVRVLVTVGPHIRPAALGPQPPHVTLERYLSQTEVLPHASVVVSHAGSGTFLGALSQGVPQVCLPQAADQFRNAKGGQASGSALVLLPSEATPQTVADAVSRVLTDVTFRAAAKVVADEIASMPSPTEVVHALEAWSSGTVGTRGPGGGADR